MLPVEFLHTAILGAGGMALALPIALHLWAQRKPTRVVFPAVRFLQQKQPKTQRNLHLRHWLLLMLRCLLLGLFALLLARPRVASQGNGPLLLVIVVGGLCLAAGGLAALLLWGQRRGWALMAGGIVAVVAALCAIVAVWGFGSQQGTLWRNQEEPVAAVLMIDTAPTMQYEHASATRLQQAQQMAERLLEQFPPGSEIGIVDASGPVGPLTTERRLAKQSIANLQMTPQVASLRDMFQHALTLLQGATASAKEVYLFSDLAASAWDAEHPELWQPILQQLTSISVQVLDVGLAEPRNVALGPLQVVPESVAVGQTVVVSTTLQQLGGVPEVLVEMAWQVPDPELPQVVDGTVRLPEMIRRDARLIALPDQGTVAVDFELKGLPEGVHHGLLRLRDLSDGLSWDDQRFFSVSIGPRQRALLCHSDSNLSQVVLQLLSTAGFDAESLTMEQLAARDLTQERVICLWDPTPLSSATWRKLQEFVERGGGLMITLGPHARPPQEFSSPQALSLLPAAVIRPWQAVESTPQAWQPRDYTHPVLAPLADQRAALDWTAFPVFQHWYLGPLQPGCRVVIEYRDGQPALIDRTVGQGRVLTFTTPLGQSTHDPQRWNRLLGELDDWPPFVIGLEALRYLGQGVPNRWNYEVREPVRVALPAGARGGNYQLFTPDATWQTLSPGSEGMLSVPPPQHVGTYRIRGGTPHAASGFSVNLAPQATQLTRHTPAQLQQRLTLSHWQFTQSIAELRRQVRLRGSYEAYAPLMVLLAAVLACEHVAANRFYGARASAIGSAAS